MATQHTRNDLDTRPHVVIVGGGFGGLYAANAMRKAPVRVTVIDRTNHSVFFPLLYQVATAGLSADEIAAPIRSILRRQRNAEVRMAEVTGVDAVRRVVLTSGGEVAYDYLVLAMGTRYSYFGHPEWQRHAPSLKSVADAARIRQRLLAAFEQAEYAQDPAEAEGLLTFVLVGGGPTGVEMAGAIAELARTTLKDEYRRIDPRAARVVLLEAGPRVLGAFPEELSAKSQRALERMGVEVRVGATVTDITAAGVRVGEEWIASHNVIWTAGVVSTGASAWLGAETDRIGRVKVRPDLSVPGHPEVFVIGDAAYLEQGGRALPGVAQVAMQQGKYVGGLIRRLAEGKGLPKPFSYWNAPNMATVGRAFAVGDFGRLRTGGFLTWLLWLVIHVYYLSGLHNQLQVLVQWTWAYFTYERNVRVLTAEPESAEPHAGAVIG
jgi:NADH dehydrogenase